MRRLLLTSALALAATTAIAAPAGADGIDGADDELTIVHASPLSASPGADLHLDVAVTSSCQASSWLLSECSTIDVAVVYEDSDGWETVHTAIEQRGGRATLTIPGWDISGSQVRYRIVATQEQCEPLTWSRPCNHLEEQTEIHTVVIR